MISSSVMGSVQFSSSLIVKKVEMVSSVSPRLRRRLSGRSSSTSKPSFSSHPSSVALNCSGHRGFLDFLRRDDDT
ncbi:unnamed protein product, partial [Brenthis ino]